jgi:hypothetical protein
MILGLPPNETDDVHFLSQVDRLVRGIVALHQPQRFVVVQIDNWFGPRWLRFAGKAVGALGIRDYHNVIIPPFVPNRVIAQSLFEKTDGVRYSFAGEGPQVHREHSSSENLTYRAKIQFPETALFWFSGGTRQNGRGSLMGYTPSPEKYWGWYLELTLERDWNVSKQVDFHESELQVAKSRSAELLGT